MWADATGYYMYLPATFIYNWNFDKMPKDIDSLTGVGFTLLKENKKIFTKYTSGIAYLQFPFFAIAHGYCKITNQDANGFSQVYVNSLLFSGVFYMLLGLFFLYYFLLKFYDKNSCLLSCIAIFLCTNIYYYGIKQPGISHIYSFFLISAVLYFLSSFKTKKLIIIFPIISLLFLIRPTNIIAILILLAFFLFNLKSKYNYSINIKTFCLSIFISLLIISPQLFYWYYISNSWYFNSYENESFSNWRSPKILEILFAASNSLFTNTPILLASAFGYYFYPISKKFTISFIILFCFIIYLNSSWWTWSFGCGYGARAFIEYYPFLAIGLTVVISKINLLKHRNLVLTLFTILILGFYNIYFIYQYDGCFLSDTWDYNEILKILLS